MKILLDARVFEQPLTGVAKSTLALYRAVLKREPSLEVVAVHRRPLCDTLPFAAERHGAWLPGQLWRESALPLAMRRLRPEIVHFPWNGGVPAWRPCGRIVTTLHDVLPLTIPGHFASPGDERAYRARVQRDLGRSDVLLTVSAYSREQIAANFKLKAPPVVIAHAPLLPQIKTPPGARGDYFLYIGGYDRRKGLEPLLESFLKLRRAGLLRSRLVLTGARNYFSTNFKQLVETGLRENAVEETGYVSDARLAELLAQAVALVYPSKHEGFGLPALDALAAGCPVLTARASALPEVCGDAALYADPDRPEAFGAALRALESDAALRAGLIEAGRRQAARFSWDAAAKLFLAALTA